MPKNLFVMISTKNSRYYTDFAVKSFLRSTRLSKDDEFYLIDNDAESNYKYGVDVSINYSPKSFAQNVNDIIARADGRDIFVLSNDVVFTPGWAEPLKQYSNILLLPSCNQTHLYKSTDNLLELKTSMTINELTSWASLLDCVEQHKKSVKPGFFETLIMGFYVFRLPAAIYKQVGLFDNQFGVGGGEDVDYRLRTLEQGYQVKYHSQSYLLHFAGKSTWDGPEQDEETRQRNKRYIEKFSSKWGEDLANLCLVGGFPLPVITKYGLEDLVHNQEFNQIIKTLLNTEQRN